MNDPQEFVDFHEFKGIKPVFFCPVKDMGKSFESYQIMRNTFPEEDFVLMINAGIIGATKEFSDEKKASIIKELMSIDEKFKNLLKTIMEFGSKHIVEIKYFPRNFLASCRASVGEWRNVRRRYLSNKK